MKCKICGGKTKIWYKSLSDDRHGHPGNFDILKCVVCGFGQTSPQINKGQIMNLYKKYYPRQKINLSKIRLENYKVPPRFKLWRKGLLNSCHFLVKQESDVLDVGSGLGYSLLFLKNMGCDVFGIDPDENAKKVANKFKLNFHLGFIEDKPFDNKKFDYVIANQVIEHTNNPISFLKLCKQRLKPNGKIIISLPNTGSLGRQLSGENWLHWHIPYHLNHFNKKSIKSLTRRVGLEITSTKTVTPNMWTNLQIRRFLIKPQEGQRDSFWDGGKENQRLAKNWTRKIFLWLEEYNIANRIIDFLGLGESLVVTLRAS